MLPDMSVSGTLFLNSGYCRWLRSRSIRLPISWSASSAKELLPAVFCRVEYVKASVAGSCFLPMVNTTDRPYPNPHRPASWSFICPTAHCMDSSEPQHLFIHSTCQFLITKSDHVGFQRHIPGKGSHLYAGSGRLVITKELCICFVHSCKIIPVF